MRGIRRYGIAAIVDVCAVATTYLVAVLFRTGARPEALETAEPAQAVLVAWSAGALQVLANVLFDVYWRDWSVAAIEDVIAVAKATLLVVVTLILAELVVGPRWLPLGAILAGGSLVLVVETTIRLRPRWGQIARAAIGSKTNGSDSIIVVGAGKLGQLLATDLASRGTYRIACFVDDDPAKIGSYVRGIRVAGSTAELPRLIDTHRPGTVVIALEPAGGPLVRRIVELCSRTGTRVRAVSGFGLQKEDRNPLRQIGVAELLEREPIDLDTPEMRETLRGRTILVTGAAGTIGSELARQVAHFEPARLVLLDTNESGLHDVLNRVPSGELLLGDVRNAPWLRHIFDLERPQVVFHAAAYKHMPIIERHPLSGIATNVLGTANVLGAAASSGVETLVFMSTDKAVDPTNVYGYTKRVGELLTAAYARSCGANYTAVRFGNVLGSSGSAFPLFTDQIDRGGPVTVTHPEATRYFMTIREAASLVIETAAIARAGDLLVLDMGAPVSIDEFVKKLIRLRGMRTPEDIEIKYTGLRPGEKLHEKLWFEHESPVGTEHPWVFRDSSQKEPPELDGLLAVVRLIAEALEQQDPHTAVRLMKDAIAADVRTSPVTSERA